MRSALFQTFAALGTTVAPAARYSASRNPAVIPADFSTTTRPPSATQRRHKLGVIETRVSPVLISFGTPIVIRAREPARARSATQECSPYATAIAPAARGG